MYELSVDTKKEYTRHIIEQQSSQIDVYWRSVSFFPSVTYIFVSVISAFPFHHHYHQQQQRRQSHFNMASAQDTKPSSKNEAVDDPYFHYYASLQNQANMLSDTLRTTGYRKAILGNSVPAFQDKTVMDIGAGSGILSFFSVEAGARHVYACEASDMATKLQLIVDQANRGEANLHLKDKITVNRGKIEACKGPQVDTLVSEPIGVLLLHERMVESYIYARDNFLKPGGAMFPSGGAIHLAPFTDDALYMETLTKASFFRQDMYGVDLSVLSEPAMAEVFAQPVVGLFPPSQLTTSTTAIHDINFYDVSLENLKKFRIPIFWTIERTSLLHGIATWFDIQFAAPPLTTPNPTAELIWQASIWSPNDLPGQQAQQPIYGPTVYPPPPVDGVSTVLSTSPHAGKTHWQQCRLLLSEPLATNSGERVEGFLDFTVNDQRSYDLTCEIWIARDGGGEHDLATSRSGKFQLHNQTFNYSYIG